MVAVLQFLRVKFEARGLLTTDFLSFLAFWSTLAWFHHAKIMSKLDKVFLMQTSQTSLDWRLIRQAILIYDSYMTVSSLCVYLVNAAGSSFYTFLCDIICNISFDRPSSPINSNVGS